MKKSQLGQIQEFRTDVLVIGSGLAGLRAAIEARRYELDVTLIDKSVIGYNSNTRLSGGHLKAAATKPRPWAAKTPTSPLEHLKDHLLISELLADQPLAEILCFEAPARKFEIKDFGVLALTGVDEKFLHDFYSFPQGVGLITPVIEALKAMKVKMRREVALVDLMVKDGQVVGAWGFHMPSGLVMVILAKAVVLATGGAPEIYLRNDAVCTTTGDGYAMAYRVGAELLDMEMQHFEPFVHAEPNLPMMDRRESRAGWYGILRNKDGEDFLPRYMKRIGPANEPFHVQYGAYNPDIRHFVARAMAIEVYEGRGDNGAVFFDLSQVPEEKWWGDKPSIYLGQVLCRGYDTKKQWIHVMPGCITTLGGLRIDENGTTSLPGLYAAGEVTGGIHGASRMGGDALVELVVFGARAGMAAARRAEKLPTPGYNDKPIREGLDRLREILARKAEPGFAPKEIRLDMKRTMWDHAGLVRTEESLSAAMDGIAQLRKDRMARVYAADLRALRTVLEVENMLDVCPMVIKSAQMRKETRGVHFRYDYPFADDANWLKNICLRKAGDDMELFTRPVRMTRWTPQTLPRENHIGRFIDGVNEAMQVKFGRKAHA